MTQQPQWNQQEPQPDGSRYSQPTNLYGQTPAPYMPYVPQVSPQETVARARSVLRRHLLVNVAMVVFPLLMFVFSGRLPWVFLVAGGVGLGLSLVRYFNARAASNRQ